MGNNEWMNGNGRGGTFRAAASGALRRLNSPTLFDAVLRIAPFSSNSRYSVKLETVSASVGADYPYQT